MKYNAFISYRHMQLDMEMAKKVHYGLETYHIPKAVQNKTGKKKIERVFRDQEELPIGSDLNDNISNALKNSDYLIVICSPDTPASYWVNKEIETFIAMHGREKILAVLISGEPNESFPEQLLTDDNGNPVEPLAADVRGATPKDRKKLFKTEILRLAAPIIGCSYDDLKQRHRERILKRNIAIASVSAAVIAIAGTAFGIYNANVADRMEKLANEKSQLADEKTLLASEKSQLADEKSELADRMEKLAGEKSQLAEEKTRLADEILLEYTEKQRNQSRFYAEEALSVFKTGNREDAALIALSGLGTDDNPRPYVPEAEYALSEILYAYSSGSGLSYDRTLSHDMIVENMNLSSDGLYLTTVDQGHNVYVRETDGFSLLAKIPPTTKDNNYLSNVKEACADKDGIYVLSDSSFSKYDLSGNVVYSLKHGSFIGGLISPVYGKAFIVGGSEISILDLKTGKELKKIENSSENYFSSGIVLSADGKKLAVSHYHYTDEIEEGLVSIIDLSDYTVSSYATSMPYIADMTFCNDNRLAVISNVTNFQSDQLFLVDLIQPDQERLWSAEINAHLQDSVSFSVLSESNIIGDDHFLTVVIDTDIYTYDLSDGKLIASANLPSHARTLNLVEGKSTAYIGYYNGDIDVVNALEGTISAGRTINTNVAISKMEIISNGIILLSHASNNIWVMKYHTAPDLEVIANLDKSSYAIGVSPDSNYFVTGENSSRICHFFDNSGKLLYTPDGSDKIPIGYSFRDNLFVIADYDGFTEVDPFNAKSQKYLFSDLGFERLVSNISFSSTGKYAVLWGQNYIGVIDLTDKKLVYSEKSTAVVGCCAVSQSEDLLLVSRTGENLNIIDLKSGDVKIHADESLRALSNTYSTRYIHISPNEKYAAFACSDGNVRILDLSSNADILCSIPLTAVNHCFISFSNDENCIFLQGDDYKLNIWKLLQGSDGKTLNAEYAGSVDDLYKISYSVEDNDGYIAFSNSYSTLLLEPKNYSRVAFADAGTTYLPSDKSFILYKNNSLYKTHYKDFKQLIAEVTNQFPDSNLSEQKKQEYNID
ncbi:MAG: TIR domain-containing protein [Lachnospiraceae bacterium]|nr:TIR domain-containing protein [Lachnospiraceae bacterium]